jgi:hypothetical protein
LLASSLVADPEQQSRRRELRHRLAKLESAGTGH